MIKELSVNNFKSLGNNFTVRLEHVNVFIGPNAVGKSTVLQAISFIKHFANDTVEEFLAERNWTANELRSKIGNRSRKNIAFNIFFELDGNDLCWAFSVTIKDDKVIGLEELVIDMTGPKFDYLLTRNSKNMSWLDKEKQVDENFPKFNLSGSMLSLIDVSDSSNTNRFPHLTAIKKYINGIISYELISPEKMRKPSRNETTDLGIGGERLASFINGLSREEKQQLFERFRKYYPFATGIQTVKKRSGWIDLNVEESINGTDSFLVNVKYLSDGLLRILFLVAITSLKDTHTAFLLDEVENGINPDLAAVLVKALIEVSREKNKQLFITTHSPTFLDYFEKEHVVLLWREVPGSARAIHFFDIPEVKQHHAYMNLGEIWASFDQTELSRLATKAEEELQEDSEDEH